jgi:hypothetical protein
MRKLNLEHLQVESFETSAASVQRGTVQAHAWTNPPQCWTDEASCGGSCGPTQCDENTCYAGCTQGQSCGGSCNCPTWEMTCEYTAPNPEGTCCGLTC